MNISCKVVWWKAPHRSHKSWLQFSVHDGKTRRSMVQNKRVTSLWDIFCRNGTQVHRATLRKKKRSDGSYLWEHPFGKWCVPQVKDQCVETTHSQSVTDDCERSFTRCPCHRKWRLSRRCTETSRHWQTWQAIWAFGHPFGNITSYTMGKKNLTWDHTMLHIKICSSMSTTQTYQAAARLW